jgi:glycerol-3-phosphate dehydrogenase subunit B
MTQIVVVGGGIAGFCAALAARRDGAEVNVYARAPGATALYAGGMEIVDDLDAVLGAPHHPFTRLGIDAVGLASELDTAVSTLVLALGKEGLKVEGGWRARGMYADIHGLGRPAGVVPDTVAPGELGRLRGKRVAVVGITQVGDYDAEATAEAMKELHGVDAYAEEFTIPDLPAAASLTDLYGRRAPTPRSRGAAVAYPPGFTGLPEGGFELLCSPPSPHGWRLQQAIGLGVVQAEVVGVDSSGGRITAVRTRDRVLHADAFVLATGRHIGGGLRAGRTIAEGLFGLGVFNDGRPIASTGRRLQHLRYLDPAAGLSSGLMTDRRLHPMTEEGDVAFENLFAAGAVLGGYDYAGPYGFGVPILTGWLAGRYAARDFAAEAARAIAP